MSSIMKLILCFMKTKKMNFRWDMSFGNKLFLMNIHFLGIVSIGFSLKEMVNRMMMKLMVIFYFRLNLMGLIKIFMWLFSLMVNFLIIIILININQIQLLKHIKLFLDQYFLCMLHMKFKFLIIQLEIHLIVLFLLGIMGYLKWGQSILNQLMKKWKLQKASMKFQKYKLMN